MRMARVALTAIGAAALLGAHPRPPQPPPVLGWPLQCRLGVDCFVQNYLDADPGPGVRDYHGGQRSYDGHNGVDIRLPSLVEQRAGVAVRSVARGRVLRVRDGVPDLDVDRRGKAAVAGEECGNGLVIDHGGGWETQYCHLARGSIAVRPGRTVRAGATIGRVGLSGDTQFPHVHLTVRHDGRVVDPFAWCPMGAPCAKPKALWKDRVAYQSGEVILTGFATHAVTSDDAQAEGSAPLPGPTRTGPALVAFAQSIGLERGDVPRISIVAPSGKTIVDSRFAPLEQDQAVFILSVGRKAPPGGFAAGVYQARFAVERKQVQVISKTFRISL